MDNNVNLEFNISAFKHGVTVDDILTAFDTYCYDGDVIDDPDAKNKFLLIGFDVNANLIEIMYNVIDDNSLNIFHAMKCRQIYMHLVNAGD